jgi:hypothetical protein
MFDPNQQRATSGHERGSKAMERVRTMAEAIWSRSSAFLAPMHTRNAIMVVDAPTSRRSQRGRSDFFTCSHKSVTGSQS